MSQQAKIKHRHCMTYNKLESGVNSAKKLLFLTITIIKTLFPLQVQYVISFHQTGHLHQKMA